MQDHGSQIVPVPQDQVPFETAIAAIVACRSSSCKQLGRRWLRRKLAASGPRSAVRHYAFLLNRLPP